MTTETEYAANQAEAAAAIGVSEDEWNVLKDADGFPPRTGKGWDLAAIRIWLEDATSATPVGDAQPAEQPPAPVDVIPLPQNTMIERVADVRTITIQIPVCPPPADSYIASASGRFNCRLDRDTQLQGFRQLHAGLREANALLANGRPVDGAPDVLRWLFEQVQAQAQLTS